MTFLHRIRQEIRYWTQSDWSFADVGAHFDDMAHDYDHINESAHSYFRRFTDTMRIANLPDNATMLDVTSRTGNGSTFFFEHGKAGKITCADVSREMGKIAQERLREAGCDTFRWMHIDNYDWDLEDGEFDVVLSLESVEHFSDPQRWVAELGRVCKPGGKLILSTPNVFWEPMHALAAITNLHHSEGPHRFVRYGKLQQYVRDAGFIIEHEETTVLIPAGPDWFIRFGGWVEDWTKNWLVPLIGLRRIIVARRV